MWARASRLWRALPTRREHGFVENVFVPPVGGGGGAGGGVFGRCCCVGDLFFAPFYVPEETSNRFGLRLGDLYYYLLLLLHCCAVLSAFGGAPLLNHFPRQYLDIHTVRVVGIACSELTLLFFFFAFFF